MSSRLSKLVSSNFYIILGALLGLYLSSLIGDSLEPYCAQNPSPVLVEIKNDVTPILVTPKRTSVTTNKSKPVRPRYYSTELGMREKLFIGIFSSEEKIKSQAVHLNNTINRLVDKAKFFITAQYKLKTKFNLTGIVGFTDTRARYRPFQVLKYVGDNFIQDYDYYFLANDYTFINAYKLLDLVKKVSVSMDVYLGTKVTDSSYCNLDSGIILSNSVLKSMREHLDWCVINAVSDDNSENIGRCVHHSIGLTCQEYLQRQSLDSFKLKHFQLDQHFSELSNKPDFNSAITIYPVLQSDSFYILNSYFLKERLVSVKNEIQSLSGDLYEIWPPGQRPGAKPATRFDVPRQYYFNLTHVFLADDFTNVRRHSSAELKDIDNVLEEVKSKLQTETADKYQFRRLINGYRVFDLSRGLDYILDLGFRDLSTGKEVVKRFEVCKPLGKVEFVPVPYVTENSRVTVILPIQETEISPSLEFLHKFSNTILDRKEKTFLMLVLLYQFSSNSKPPDDAFQEIKNFATTATNKYRNDDNIKILWVSIRLPESPNRVQVENHKVLNFAVVDLALKKIGLESLVLILDSFAIVSSDFLNRIRMNTIPDFQIFSPIPFRQYNPEITHMADMDVNKNSGHFDREEFKYISFYSKDYVEARKRFQHKVPLVRVDNDITNILQEHYESFGNIFEMFLFFGGKIHAMRATEMGLKVRYRQESDAGRFNLFLGNQAQLGKLLLDKVPDLN